MPVNINMADKWQLADLHGASPVPQRPLAWVWQVMAGAWWSILGQEHAVVREPEKPSEGLELWHCAVTRPLESCFLAGEMGVIVFSSQGH